MWQAKEAYSPSYTPYNFQVQYNYYKDNNVQEYKYDNV